MVSNFVFKVIGKFHLYFSYWQFSNGVYYTEVIGKFPMKFINTKVIYILANFSYT